MLCAIRLCKLSDIWFSPGLRLLLAESSELVSVAMSVRCWMSRGMCLVSRCCCLMTVFLRCSSIVVIRPPSREAKCRCQRERASAMVVVGSSCSSCTVGRARGWCFFDVVDVILSSKSPL